MKAATRRFTVAALHLDVSIHAAREGGDDAGRLGSGGAWVSIHAAREGGDERGIDAIGYITVSIHAAREGGDLFRQETQKPPGCFNPRRP